MHEGSTVRLECVSSPVISSPLFITCSVAAYFSFSTTQEKNNSSKMRLYDQRSSTPIKSDSKKWMRPNNFLPSQREIAVVEPPNISGEKYAASAGTIKNETCGSETSASTAIEISKLYKHRTIYDDFRFDIDIDEDQELSMKSSSTLSTHSTLRQLTQVSHDGYREGMLKPISVAKYGGIDPDSLEFSRSSFHALNNNIIATSSFESLATKSRNNIARYSLSNDYVSTDEDSSNDDDDFFTPKLTLTESSEDTDSVWLDFVGFDIKNPFRASHDTYESNKNKPALDLSSVVHQTPDVKNLSKRDNKVTPTRNISQNKRMVPGRSPIMRQTTGTYTKYYKMLLDGISVVDVSNAMEKDEIDPSIISLVLAASETRHNVYKGR